MKEFIEKLYFTHFCRMKDIALHTGQIKCILNSSHSDTNILYHDTTTTQQEHKGVQRKVCFIINAFLIKKFEKTLQKDIDRKVFKANFTKVLQENIYFQDHFSTHNPFPKTYLQTTMSKRTSQADMKGKGKAPTMQPKQF